MHFILIFWALFGAPTPAIAAQLTVPIYAPSTASDIILSYAVHYAISGKEFLGTAECESGFNEKAYNPNDPDTGSRGVFQFQRSTFKKYARLAGIEGDLNIWDPMQQIQTAAYMFSIHEEKQWTCWKDKYGSRTD